MNAEEFETWKESLLTQEILAHLGRRRQQVNDLLVDHCFAAKETNAMVHAAKLTGLIIGLNELLELRHEDLQMKETK